MYTPYAGAAEMLLHVHIISKYYESKTKLIVAYGEILLAMYFIGVDAVI